MCGLAEFFLEKGFNVSGSDSTRSAITDKLAQNGAEITYNQNGEKITENTDLIIYTSAIREDNPEFMRAKKLGIKMIKRSAALGEIVNKDKLISVSGTHGKTTTTSIIAKVFIDAGEDPTVFVGGLLEILDGNASRNGSNNISIAEADEYDRSFHTLRSDIIVITNIEEDHLDIYKDLNDIKESFKTFVSNSKQRCRIIACGDDENVRTVLKECSRDNIIYYGFNEDNDEIISNVTTSENSISFDLNSENIMLRIKGKHNILNSSAAYIAGKICSLDVGSIKKSLNEFSGVKRRLELKYSNSIKVYDDYAHHPTEVRATLEALRSSGSKRIITVFQPHLFSRTQSFYKEFADALSGTDILILNKIYPAREKEIEGVTSELIKNEMGDKVNSYYSESKGEVFKILNKIRTDNDVIVFMGAGNITDQCSEYINLISAH